MPDVSPLPQIAPRLHFLDSLRGLACATVFFSHFVGGFTFGLSFFDDAFSTAVLHFWYDGMAAVSLFFVLSGYVLSTGKTVLGTEKVVDLRSWVSYAVARVFRLHPPFIVALLCSLGMFHLKATELITNPTTSGWLRGIWPSFPPTYDIFMRATLLPIAEWQRGGVQPILIPQAWSLVQEFTFSLILPIGIWILQRGSLLFLLLVCMAIRFLSVPARYSASISLLESYCPISTTK